MSGKKMLGEDTKLLLQRPRFESQYSPKYRTYSAFTPAKAGWHSVGHNQAGSVRGTCQGWLGFGRKQPGWVGKTHLPRLAGI